MTPVTAGGISNDDFALMVEKMLAVLFFFRVFRDWMATRSGDSLTSQLCEIQTYSGIVIHSSSLRVIHMPSCSKYSKPQ